MITFSCSKLADYLDNITEIKELVTGGVRFGKMVKDTDEMIVSLRLVGDEPNTELENFARIQMICYIPRSQPASIAEQVFNLVNKYLISKDESQRVRDIDGFKIRNVIAGSSFGPDYDFQDNIVISKDYLFIYPSN